MLKLIFIAYKRLVILGSYGLRLESGEITVSGAGLTPSEDRHWIHAPCSHALPVIRCVEDASLELHSHPGAQSLQDMSRLSPQFNKLWNETSTAAPGQNAIDKTLSFQIVSSRPSAIELFSYPLY